MTRRPIFRRYQRSFASIAILSFVFLGEVGGRAYADENNAWLVEVDLLKGWIRGSSAPPLVTTSASTVPRNEAGVLSNSTTSSIFGDGLLDIEHRTGTRFRLQRGLASEGDYGIYFGGMYLANGSDPATFRSDAAGLPVLGRPFLNSNNQSQDAQLVSYPDVLVGQVAVSTASELYLGDLGISRTLLRDEEFVLDLHAGYRYLSFRDGLSIREDLRSTDQGGVIPLDTTFVVQDSFATLNQFHGGSFGGTLKAHAKEWELGFYTGVSLGGLSRKLRINGSTDVNIPGLPTDAYAGGLLALPTNIGSYQSTKFVAIPELRLFANRLVNQRLSVNFGYNFLLAPQTWRAAEQVDYTVNESQIGGGALSGTLRPAFLGASSDMWIQTLSLGFGYRW
jgi:hypothetical protein